MKLTNMIRDAFVRAAMDDVPKVYYAEQALVLAHKTMNELREKTFPGVDLILAEDWFEKRSVTMPTSFNNIYTSAPHSNVLKMNTKVWAKLEELNLANTAQSKKLEDLRTKLRAVAYSCTTRKALADLLPEFEKYLPADTPAAMRTLPVVANVVADFTKAGWPKTQPKKGA